MHHPETKWGHDPASSLKILLGKWFFLIYSMVYAGFIIIRPTENGLKLWETTCNLTSVRRRINDQVAFNQAIKQLRGTGNLRLYLQTGFELLIV